MSEGIGRNPPSGEVVVRKGSVIIPAIAVGASSSGSGSFTFDGAQVHDMVQVNARAALGNVSAPQAFVSAVNTITLIFATGGAALTVPTQAVDVTVGQW